MLTLPDIARSEKIWVRSWRGGSKSTVCISREGHRGPVTRTWWGAKRRKGHQMPLKGWKMRELLEGLERIALVDLRSSGGAL